MFQPVKSASDQASPRASRTNSPIGTRPVSKVDFVYETLKEAILTGQFKPGDPLVQTRMAETLGVSPIPVMAAIARLVAEGLVVQEPHYRPRVSSFSREGLEELMTVRVHLEVLATRTSVPHIGRAALAELRRLADHMTTALERQQLHRYASLNKAFHMKIYESGPYRLLVQMIRDLWDNTDRHGLRSMFALPVAWQSQRDHLKLLELIDAGDAEAAARLTEEHKARFREAFIRAAETGAAHPGDAVGRRRMRPSHRRSAAADRRKRN